MAVPEVSEKIFSRKGAKTLSDGQSPSSRANARDLRQISPIGRNDILHRPLRPSAFAGKILPLLRSPDIRRNLLNQLQLAPLIVFGDQVANDVRRKAALRAEGELL